MTKTKDLDIIGPIVGIMLIALLISMLAPSEEEPEEARLKGYVRNTKGDPISGVELKIGEAGYTTSDDGYYEFTDLTPGTVILEVVNAEDLGYEYKPPISVNLTAGDNVKDIVLTTPALETKANLCGVVRNYTTLDLIGGVVITLNSHETTTNIYGLYSFHNIEPGDYTLTVSKSGFDTKTINITLVAGDNTQDIMLVPEGVPAAEFEVSDLTIDPTQVSVGEQVNIGVSVTNVGDAEGTYTVNCDISPSTYTIMEVAPAITIPLDAILNTMIIVMLMSTSARILKEL